MGEYRLKSPLQGKVHRKRREGTDRAAFMLLFTGFTQYFAKITPNLQHLELFLQVEFECSASSSGYINSPFL